MSDKYTALENKTFVVDLASSFGSSNYGWCLTSLPKEIILMGIDTLPTVYSAQVIQRFYFGVTSSENLEVSLGFALTCLSDITKAANTYKVDVLIVPANSEEYESYSENEAQTVLPYGFVHNGNGGANHPATDYGYPCGVQDAMVKYGYPCSVQDTTALKYGYPCGVQDAMVKYGYPCSVQDTTALKYGYPCGVQDTTVKYGYPCGVQDATSNALYGYPRVAYGYPYCG